MHLAVALLLFVGPDLVSWPLPVKAQGSSDDTSHNLLSSISNRSVHIHATATGLAPGEPLEFLLIGPDSSHGYESFATCDRSATDIRAAMMSAGLAPGTPADPDAFLFQPRGERLRITVSSSNGVAIPLESLIAPAGAVAPPPFPGFVFSGSQVLSNNTDMVLADSEEPYSIISTYNEAASIMDVNGTATQESSYGTRTLAEAGIFEKGTALTFTIQPWFSDGGHRTNIALNLGDTDILPYLKFLTTNETEVFLTITWATNLTVHSAIHQATLIQQAIDTAGIIPEPPPTHTLYYRAFLPDPQHRDRSGRLEQPWELHLSTGAIPEMATATWIDEAWADGAVDAILTPHETVVRSGMELEAALTTHPGLPVILVYASPFTTISGIMRFLSPCLDTHSTIYVFEE